VVSLHLSMSGFPSDENAKWARVIFVKTRMDIVFPRMTTSSLEMSGTTNDILCGRGTLDASQRPTIGREPL
jgi:hypothetical protein